MPVGDKTFLPGYLEAHARRALREAWLPGVNACVFSGSASQREQAQAIMTADRNWQLDGAKVKRANEPYTLQAQQDARRKK